METSIGTSLKISSKSQKGVALGRSGNPRIGELHVTWRNMWIKASWKNGIAWGKKNVKSSENKINRGNMM